MRILGIAIAMFFAGLVLWALAANATPLHGDKLADQFCTTKCHWSHFWGREVCETDCTDYKLQQHDQQLAQYDQQEQDAERAEWKRKRELWLKYSRTQRRRCWTECNTNGQTGGCIQHCDQ